MFTKFCVYTWEFVILLNFWVCHGTNMNDYHTKKINKSSFHSNKDSRNSNVFTTTGNVFITTGNVFKLPVGLHRHLFEPELFK